MLHLTESDYDALVSMMQADLPRMWPDISRHRRKLFRRTSLFRCRLLILLLAP
jgi:hypothetical protein